MSFVLLFALFFVALGFYEYEKQDFVVVVVTVSVVGLSTPLVIAKGSDSQAVVA